MKRYIIVFGVAFCFFTMQSQDVSDAIRYSETDMNGTARFKAMGGAFGALGGDLSAINLNPASSAIFINNQIGGSLSSFNSKNNSDYFGKKTSDRTGSLDLNQAGGVFVFENSNTNSNWKKFSIAINFENTTNFDNKVYSGGINPTNSGINYFISKANGNLTSVLDTGRYENISFNAQQGWLAYQSYLINPLTPNSDNDLYSSNSRATGNYYQENEIVTTGYNGKISFNIATQYKDFLYMGLNLNSHFTDYTKSTSFYEDYINSRDNDIRRGIQSFRFNNDLYTYGNGFSLQLGAIVKPTKEISLGLSYESSTWYTLNDELMQNINSKCADCKDNINRPITNISIDPNFRNYYDPYQLKTPSKISASIAYIFGKRALLSFDYSNKNYGNIIFEPESDDYFRDLNSTTPLITRSSTSEYRVGGEYRIKQVSLRAGYRFVQSPYKDTQILGNQSSFSGGFGYNFGGSRLDFALTNVQRQYNQQFFNEGLTDSAKINSKNNTFTVTYVFEL
jgi:hypothetical protein